MDPFDDDELSDSNDEKDTTSKKFKSSIYKDSQDKSSSLLSPIKFGKPKLTRAEKRFIKYKRALKKIKNINNKINCIFLNEYTRFNNKQIRDEFYKEKALLDEKKFINMIKFFNKIREIVNSTDANEINKFIFQNDFTTYNIKVDNPNKNTSNNNIINVENNKTGTTNNNITNKKNLNKIPPIKNFWKLSLINCQFFKINKMDGEILNFLRDIMIIPLDYPNFRIEYHFKQNDYLKQNILTKEYFYTNTKREKLYKSNGCDIEWDEDDKNPTLKHLKQVVKDIKVHKKTTKIKKVKEEAIYSYTDSFFKMFDIDKSTIEKDFNESKFFITDFFPNILEYYLNIIEIKYDNVEDELISNN